MRHHSLDQRASVVTPNSCESSAGERPARTNSTICWRNSAGYGRRTLDICDSLNTKNDVSTESGQLQLQSQRLLRKRKSSRGNAQIRGDESWFRARRCSRTGVQMRAEIAPSGLSKNFLAVRKLRKVTSWLGCGLCRANLANATISEAREALSRVDGRPPATPCRPWASLRSPWST